MKEQLERARLAEFARINAHPADRAELEAKHGQLWNTQEMTRDFEVVGFATPFVVVRRRADGQLGSLMFQHHPRTYFDFLISRPIPRTVHEMRILSHTCSTDADYNGGCAYALIEISPERAKKILARMDELEAACRKDASAHELSFWDCDVQFLTAQFLSGDESLEDHLPEDGSYEVLPANILVPEDCIERTEYEHMVVAFNGSQPGDSQSGGDQPEVYWLASPKHCSLYVETMPLPRSLIQQAAAAEKGDRRRP